MKKIATGLGIVLLVVALAIPVLAFGPGWGMGSRMGGDWGPGPGYCWGNGGNYSQPAPEQSAKLNELDRKFSEEMAGLRDRMWAKSAELDAVLNAPNPDIDKAKALQKEINDLRSAMADNQLNYEVEARKLSGTDAYAGRYGGGYGRGMMGYGRGGCGY
jgi:zinc resistance-associated protein